VAIITQAVMAMGLIVVSAVLKLLLAEADLAAISNATLRKIVQTLKEESVFTLLTNFVIFASSIFYALCVLAVFVLRRRQAQRERPYRTWGYPWTPLAFLAFYAWFLYRVYCDQPFESYAGLVLIALGLPVFWAFARKGRAAC
jgi:APA family basic amino acid/polyamine antiporter